MDQSRTNCLYCYIKKVSQEKGRPLKIISDWDECLLPRDVFSHYLYFQEITGKKPPFAEFFKEFWGKGEVVAHNDNNVVKLAVKSSGIKEIEKEREKNPEAVKSRTKKIAREKVDFYELAPFLTFSEDLLKALRENLISSLVLPANYDPRSLNLIESSQDIVDCPRKRWKTRKTFGLFPQVSRATTPPITLPNGKEQYITRADWTAREHPDFDIFIDDNPMTTQRIIDLFPDRTVVLPDYEMNKGVKGANVYRFANQPIDLKNEDFAKAAQEYKTRQETKLERERREAWKQRALGYTFGLLIVILLCGGYWIILKLWSKKIRK